MMTENDLENVKKIFKTQLILNDMDRVQHDIRNMNRVLRFKGCMIIVGLLMILFGIINTFFGDKTSSLFMFMTAQIWFVGSIIYRG